jgi:hypothetical protein
MAGLVPAIHALLLPGYRKEDVDARDIRAFTPVFDGLLRGHDDGGCIDVGDLPHPPIVTTVYKRAQQWKER